jgi:hypothetical protein
VQPPGCGRRRPSVYQWACLTACPSLAPVAGRPSPSQLCVPFPAWQSCRVWLRLRPPTSHRSRDTARRNCASGPRKTQGGPDSEA